MLQVRVHHGHDRRGRGAHAFDRRAGKAATSEALDHPDARVAATDLARRIGGTVAAVVVDEDRLPTRRAERRFEPGDHRRDVGGFIEGRQDDGQLERLGGDSLGGGGESGVVHVHGLAGYMVNINKSLRAAVHA